MRFARKWRRQRSGGRVGGPGSSVSDAGSPIGSERLETRLRLTRFARRRLKSRRFVVGILQRSAGAPAFWRKPLLFFLLRRAHLFSLRAPAECVGGAVSRASRLVFGIPRGGFLVADECGARRGRRSGPGPELIYGNGPLSDSLCSLGGLRPAWQSAPARGQSYFPPGDARLALPLEHVLRRPPGCFGHLPRSGTHCARPLMTADVHVTHRRRRRVVALEPGRVRFLLVLRAILSSWTRNNSDNITRYRFSYIYDLANTAEPSVWFRTRAMFEHWRHNVQPRATPPIEELCSGTQGVITQAVALKLSGLNQPCSGRPQAPLGHAGRARLEST